jgi:hypothetical protein
MAHTTPRFRAFSIAGLANIAHVRVIDVRPFPAQLSVDSGGTQIFAKLQPRRHLLLATGSRGQATLCKGCRCNSDVAVLSCES